jgi:hypothetical protein
VFVSFYTILKQRLKIFWSSTPINFSYGPPLVQHLFLRPQLRNLVAPRSENKTFPYNNAIKIEKNNLNISTINFNLNNVYVELSLGYKFHFQRKKLVNKSVFLSQKKKFYQDALFISWCIAPGYSRAKLCSQITQQQKQYTKTDYIWRRLKELHCVVSKKTKRICE